MSTLISPRLATIVEALPLWEGVRILEIGCGTGIMARHMADKLNSCFILGLDRSIRSLQKAELLSARYLAEGRINYHHGAIEDFQWPAEAEKFDFAVAIRVGVLDGRHPKGTAKALANIAGALKKGGKLHIDKGNPLIEIDLFQSVVL